MLDCEYCNNKIYSLCQNTRSGPTTYLYWDYNTLSYDFPFDDFIFLTVSGELHKMPSFPSIRKNFYCGICESKIKKGLLEINKDKEGSFFITDNAKMELIL